MSAVLPHLDYAPAPAEPGPSNLRARYGVFVGGAWSDAAGGVAETLNPADERQLCEVARASAEDVERAVRAARRGYEKYWRKLRPAERAKHLFRLTRAVGERAEELGWVQSLDAGTPIRRSREHDVPQALATLFAYAGWADKLAWTVSAGERTRPLGVVAAFASSSAAALEAACALGPALAAGNAAILVPAQFAPLAALVLAQAALDADLPPGVLSVVTGDERTRAAFVEHDDIDALAAGGARAQRISIARRLAGTGRRAILRPDDGAVLIVCEDAPLEAAVEGIVRAAWLERGPFAPEGVRLFVQESVLEEVLEALEVRLSGLRLGDPLDENSDAGPLASHARREAAETYVAAALESGATLVRGATGPLPERGYWYSPGLVRGGDLGPEVRPCAPLLPVSSFRTIAEVLQRVTAVGPAGSAGVWTASGQLAAYLAQRLPAENVWCNAYARYDSSAYAGGAACLRAHLHT